MVAFVLLLVLGFATALQPPYGALVSAALGLGGIIASIVVAVRQVQGWAMRVVVVVALVILAAVAIPLLLAQGIPDPRPFIFM